MRDSVPLFLPVPDSMPTEFPFGPAPKAEFDEWHEDGVLVPICFIVGVDLGQARDFSTIVIDEVNFAERVHKQRPKFAPVGTEVRREKITYHRLRHVERIPLGTSYPDVLDRVSTVMGTVPPLPRDPVLVMDATGVGRPVMDLARKHGLTPLGVTITAGSNETCERDDYRVAKKILASTVAVALDTERLQVVAVGDHVGTLRKELQAFRVKVTANQNESFESWREQDHDDLVLASAMAIWAGERLRDRYRVNPHWRLFSGI
jgi:hypothetical protein